MDVIPVGYCQCGCGKKTTIPRKTSRGRGAIAGVPRRFVSGHHPRNPDYGPPTPLLIKDVISATTSIVEDIRGLVRCAHCGGQPIEWHSEAHVGHPGLRVSHLMRNGARIERILEEIVRCTPLCRRCHMKEDGRLAAFLAYPRNTPEPPKSCQECGRLYKPMRRGLCSRCYDRRFRPGPNSHRRK